MYKLQCSILEGNINPWDEPVTNTRPCALLTPRGLQISNIVDYVMPAEMSARCISWGIKAAGA
jgi:hypothetical protein